MAPATALLAACLAGLSARVDAVRARSYPELAGLDVEAVLFSDPEDRARAFVGRGWADARHRRYEIRLNESLCSDAPPPAALDALIAHELAHAADYSRRSRLSLLRLLAVYAVAPEGDAVAAYERATDAAAVRAGYAAGLKSYREWLFARLTPARVAVKRRLYLTPEELTSERASP